MNTIPTTSSAPRVTYAVFGGAAKARVRKYQFPLSIVIFNRGGRLFRESALDELPAGDQFEIISIEGPEAVPEIDSLTRKYPAVRFLLLQADCTIGEKINLGIEEAQSKLVFVAASDLRIPLPALSERLLKKIEEHALLCTLPVLKTPRQETVPSLMVPGFSERRLKIVPWAPLYDGMRSLFPFDFAGIYHKEKFRFSGGFDGSLPSPYWQKADFGLRNWLWGEELAVSTALYCQYRREMPPEDATPDESYKFFYLKNVSVEYRSDQGVLGYRKFLGYFLKSGVSFWRALAEFRGVRRWARENRYRFKTDAPALVDLWPVPE